MPHMKVPGFIIRDDYKHSNLEAVQFTFSVTVLCHQNMCSGIISDDLYVASSNINRDSEFLFPFVFVLLPCFKCTYAWCHGGHVLLKTADEYASILTKEQQRWTLTETTPPPPRVLSSTPLFSFPISMCAVLYVLCVV